MTHITLEESKLICEAAITKAQQLGIKIAVSVVENTYPIGKEMIRSLPE